jgi:hypothetical protein
VHKGVVQKSQSTITPITHVPLIILYVNGVPYIEYRGPYQFEALRNFILETYRLIEKEISFTRQSRTQFPNAEHPNVYHDPSKNRIPKYSLGEPLTGDDMRCYLTVIESQGRAA